MQEFECLRCYLNHAMEAARKEPKRFPYTASFFFKLVVPETVADMKVLRTRQSGDLLISVALGEYVRALNKGDRLVINKEGVEQQSHRWLGHELDELCRDETERTSREFKAASAFYKSRPDQLRDWTIRHFGHVYSRDRSLRRRIDSSFNFRRAFGIVQHKCDSPKTLLTLRAT